MGTEHPLTENWIGCEQQDNIDVLCMQMLLLCTWLAPVLMQQQWQAGGRPTEDAVVVVAFVKSYSILFQMRCRFWCLGPQLREVPKRPGNCLLYIEKEMYLSLRRALPWQLPPQPRTFAQDKPHFANGSCTFKFNCPPVLPSSCHCIKSFVAAPGPATDP